MTRNDCGSTPVWKNPEAVVNLREKDYKTFMNRRDGVKYAAKDVKNFNPDFVLLGKSANVTLEQL